MSGNINEKNNNPTVLVVDQGDVRLEVVNQCGIQGNNRSSRYSGG